MIDILEWKYREQTACNVRLWDSVNSSRRIWCSRGGWAGDNLANFIPKMGPPAVQRRACTRTERKKSDLVERNEHTGIQRRSRAGIQSHGSSCTQRTRTRIVLSLRWGRQRHGETRTTHTENRATHARPNPREAETFCAIARSSKHALESARFRGLNYFAMAVDQPKVG